ncbi:MAG: molybdopterin-dependent oxidoreductase [bacterium]|nr:molybdopterin-dependent oxidoreductase [bacterium]
MNYSTGICTFCGTGCGHLLQVNDGKVEGVFPSQNHPVSKGRLCVRGWNIHELLRTDQRITTPRIKKNGSFAQADYPEAIGYVVEQLQKYSAGEIAFLGSPRSSNEENYLFMKLARTVFKTNNISLDSESGHRNSLNVLHAGTGMAGMLGSLDDIGGADFILIVGTEMLKQNPIVASEIHMAARAGTRVVTIDSRKTQIAELSSSFLPVKPGSTKLVLAAMAKSLIEGNKIDPEFLEKKTYGFDGFANSLGSINTVEIEAKTGQPYTEIQAIAAELAEAERGMVFFPSGISGLDEDTIRYLYNLFLMAGKVGKPGCGVNPLTGINNLQGGYDMGVAPDLLTGFQSLEDPDVVNKFRKVWNTDINTKSGNAVYDMLSEGGSALKALVVVDHDEGIVRYENEIKDLDLVIYIGAFENDFAKHAHVVLPMAAYFETQGTYTNTERRIQRSEKKLDPPANVLPGWELYSQIAQKASADWKYTEAGDVLAEIAQVTPAYSAVKYNEINRLTGVQWPCTEEKPEGTGSFAADAGNDRLNFVDVSGTFTTPSGSGEYPYLLLVGKAQYFWHRNNLLKKTYIPMREYNTSLLLYPEGYIELSPEDAKKLEVRNKWAVKVVSASGEMTVDVMVSDAVQPGTTCVPYFVRDRLAEFLLEHTDVLKHGEDATIPIRIERV